MASSYKTVAGEAQAEVIIQKSRFLGHVAPTTSDEQAVAFIERIRSEHREASHNCYAYVIGQNQGIQRFSDDGEPGGTAGMPILEVIKNNGLVDTTVVVTRYFGGILLGAGGLVRAYTQTAAEAIRVASIANMVLSEKYKFEFEYPRLGRIENFLRNSRYILDEIIYLDKVSMLVTIKNEDREPFIRDMEELGDGKIALHREEEFYHPWP